jgi:hypothetical protein
MDSIENSSDSFYHTGAWWFFWQQLGNKSFLVVEFESTKRFMVHLLYFLFTSSLPPAAVYLKFIVFNVDRMHC